MTALRPMTGPEYAAWLAASVPAYAADKVAAGQWAEAEAQELARQDYATSLPRGLATPGNHLFTIEDDARRPVGMLWFAETTRSGARIAYVYDVSIRPDRRREGHARRAFLALEKEAERLGLSGIALHVFGHNVSAQALYARLGFRPTNINLFKPVGGPGGPSGQPSPDLAPIPREDPT